MMHAIEDGRGLSAERDQVALYWYSLGNALEKSGGLREAAIAFEQALDLDSSLLSAARNLAATRVRLAQSPESMSQIHSGRRTGAGLFSERRGHAVPPV